ncbi:hypothetical protein QCD79_25685, partial [Pseudomonas quasicaspiana]|nr:hypothetical protein [Pseudomonas quasicaspiana]
MFEKRRHKRQTGIACQTASRTSSLLPGVAPFRGDKKSREQKRITTQRLDGPGPVGANLFAKRWHKRQTGSACQTASRTSSLLPGVAPFRSDQKSREQTRVTTQGLDGPLTGTDCVKTTTLGITALKTGEKCSFRTLESDATPAVFRLFLPCLAVARYV